MQWKQRNRIRFYTSRTVNMCDNCLRVDVDKQDKNNKMIHNFRSYHLENKQNGGNNI